MSGQIPIWLADLLGVEISGESERAAWELVSRWTWAPWATLLFVLVAIGWVAHFYSRERSLAGPRFRGMLVLLRLAAMGILLVMLAQVVLFLRPTGPPSLAIIIDRSASMATADRYADSKLYKALRQRLSQIDRVEPTRLNLAKLLLTEENGRLLQKLSKKYHLEIYFAAASVERYAKGSGAADWNLAHCIETIRQLTPDGADSGSTRLGHAVRHVLGDWQTAPPAALILFTDGITTEGPSIEEGAQNARHQGVPFMLVGLGDDQPPRDLELADLLVDDVVFAGDLVHFQTRIKATGLEGKTVSVTLRDAGGAKDHQNVPPLAEQTFNLSTTEEQTIKTVELTHRPTSPGKKTYVVEVLLQEGGSDLEINTDNNRQERTVLVRDEKIRVLLAQAYPSYEFRYLKTVLERDTTIELSTYLQEADPDYASQDRSALRSFPIGQAPLFEYDVVLLGDTNPQLLPRSVWKNLKAFVTEKGGGLGLLAGPRFMPRLYEAIPEIRALLPIELATSGSFFSQASGPVTQGFIVQPTPLGLRSGPFQLGDTRAETEEIWRGLPPLYWMVEVARLKPATQVFAEHPTLPGPRGGGAPIICSHYVGAGQVLFHATDATWRWRQGVGDVFFARYWIQTIRSLARGKLVSGRGIQLTTDRREYRQSEPVQIRARFFDERLAPPDEEIFVFVEGPNKPREKISLRRRQGMRGVFEGTLSPPGIGKYHLLLPQPIDKEGSASSVQFSVVARPGELARLEMDRAALTSAAERTQGQFFTIRDAEQLFDALPRGRRVPIENPPPVSLWNRWWLLLLFVGLLTTEWIARKRKGML